MKIFASSSSAVPVEAPAIARPALGTIGDSLVALARRTFGIDERSLALFRIGLGIALLVDWTLKLDHISVFYTDSGVLPRAAAQQFWDTRYLNSIFFATGTFWGTLVLMLPMGLLAAAVLVGWRTRLMSALALVMMISAQVRDFPVVQGSDDLLRALLFWSLFLPVGRVWSVDAAMDTSSRDSSPDRIWFSAGCIALLLQTSYVYVMGAVIKSTNPVWWEEGTAIYYAMNIDQFATWLSPYLLEFPTFMSLLTRFVFLLELLGPFLMLVPWRTAQIRVAVLAGLLVMHIGFKLFLQVGMFPLVSLISLTPFIPGIVWVFLEKRLRPASVPAIQAMYYDAPCTFCFKTCLLLRTLLGLGRVEIVPAQSHETYGEMLRQNNSWVVVDEYGGVHMKGAALAAVFSASPVFRWVGRLLAVPRLQGLVDRVYDLVGRNRMALGRVTAVALPLRDNGFRRRPAIEAVCLLLTGVVLWWNVSTLPGRDGIMPGALREFVLMTRLEQKWDMFAPTPLLDDGWYVMRGILADGSVVDAMNGVAGEPSGAKPADVAGMYPSQLWRKYMVNLAGQGYAPLRPWFARWACRQWNDAAAPEGMMRELQIYYVIERTQPPGQPPAMRSDILWQGACT